MNEVSMQSIVELETIWKSGGYVNKSAKNKDGDNLKSLKQKCDCGRDVSIFISTKDRQHGYCSYAIKCAVCGIVLDNLPTNCSGKQVDAIEEWNRTQKQKKARPL